jgi:hypothetical protein
MCDLRALIFGLLSSRLNALVALICSRDKKTIMNCLLFVLEAVLVVAGIALVPARSELRIEISDQGDDIDHEMAHDEIDPQQSDDMGLQVEVSDEALETAYGELTRGLPTLAYGSYCFTCRPQSH